MLKVSSPEILEYRKAIEERKLDLPIWERKVITCEEAAAYDNSFYCKGSMYEKRFRRLQAEPISLSACKPGSGHGLRSGHFPADRLCAVAGASPSGAYGPSAGRLACFLSSAADAGGAP